MIAPEIERFVAEDRAHGGPADRTLLAYADADLNAKAAAEALLIHVNTAHYRLGRIAEQHRLRPAPAVRRHRPADRGPADGRPSVTASAMTGRRCSTLRPRRRPAPARRAPRRRAAAAADHRHRRAPRHVGAVRPPRRRPRADRLRPARRRPLAAAVLPLRMSGLARVVTELLDVLGLERVDVLGYSFGGGLAQELAHRAPERVRRLVLCATAPGLGGIPPRPMAALMLATPARYYHPRLLALSLPHIAGGRTARDPGGARRARRRALAAPPVPSATPTSSTRSRAGRACPWLHRVAHPTSSSPARTTRASRCATPACSPRDCRRAPARRQGRRPPLPARRARERRRGDPRFLDED